jgi:dTDP-D-glucose 4,6-dehydratase
MRLRPEKSEVFRLYGSNTKLKLNTNWKQSYNLDLGLKETIDWFKDSNNLKKYKFEIYNI